jgi:hypothetical protein
VLQVKKINAHYDQLASCSKRAEGISMQLVRSCRERDTARMHARHAAMRQRLSSSEHLSSTHRVLSGWPHQKPGIPHVPSEREAGAIVPSTAQVILDQIHHQNYVFYVQLT